MESSWLRWLAKILRVVAPRLTRISRPHSLQIAALTNGAYRSAVHRVLTTSTTPRYSTAVFAYFSWGARVSPLPSFAPPPGEPPLFPPRTTEEYFRFKLGESVRVDGYA